MDLGFRVYGLAGGFRVGEREGGEAQSKRRLEAIADRGRGERNEEREGKAEGTNLRKVWACTVAGGGRGVRGAERVRRVRGVGRVWAYIGALYRLLQEWI